jgi:hypothetical protein
MEKSNMRIRPVFIWFLVGSFLLSLGAIAFLPEPGARKKARITYTRVWEKKIAIFLQQRVVETGELTNLDNRSIAQGVLGTNNFHSDLLNSQGKFLDYWKTPIQIEILARTNFIIRSAGPNRKPGDADDIIFNSLTNDFVKP